MKRGFFFLRTAGIKYNGKTPKPTGPSVGRNRGIDVHTASLTVKTNATVDQSKNRVVLANSHSAARNELGTTLADDDVSRHHNFTPELFDTQTLAYAVATVFYRTLTFLVSHNEKIVRFLILRGGHRKRAPDPD
jgi:hypothetical protein